MTHSPCLPCWMSFLKLRFSTLRFLSYAFCLVVFALILPALPAAARPPSVVRQFFPGHFPPRPSLGSTGENKVFAHFQMSCYDYGTIPTGGIGSVSGYVEDIAEAASIGIDGFSLDYGADVTPYPESLANMFVAADQYNVQHPDAPFTLFLTFDYATFPRNPALIASITAQYANNPAYYHYLGRPFLSTYTGEGGGYAAVKHVFGQVLTTLRAKGINPYFVPGFITTDASGHYISDTPDNDAAWAGSLLSGLADGAWQYADGGAPIGPGSGIPYNESKAAAVEAAGLTWMAPVMTQYWGAGHSAAHDGVNRFYEEYYGGKALAVYWQSIINVQKPHWVQICTWNDLDEASNITNADLGPTGPWPYLAHSSVPGYYKSKLGLQAALSYYIQWYKTGRQPVLTNDTLVAYYRTQTAALVPSADPLGPIVQTDTEDGQSPDTSAIPDDIFLDCFLAKPGRITLSVGGTTITRPVPKGASHLRLPFVPGTPQITLSRLGVTLVTLNGEPIVAASEYVNANYYTCTAHD